MTYRSDPTRWSQAQLSSSEGAPEFLRDAFQAGAHEGPSDLQMRTLALKLTAIGTGTALAAGASAAHASATAAGKVATGGAFGAIKTGGALTLSKIAVSLALVGAASAGAVYFQRGSALQALAPSVHHLAPTESQVLATPVVVETLRASVTSPTPVKNTAVAVASLDKPALDKPAAAAHAHDEKPPSVTIGEADQAAPGSSLSTHGGAPVAVKSHRVVRQERRATSATSNEDDTIDLAAPAANKSATAARVSVAGERQQLSEIELLRNARSALAARPREAYRLAAEHKAFYPQGVFAQERDALAVEALQRGGDLELARQLAQSFVQRYPDSPHAHRFRETMNLP